MWLRSVMSETDERIRANLIESLWSRKEPEVEAVFRIALKDAHSRVVANSVYGLYLMGSNGWDEALNFLVSHPRPAFRRAAVWVIRSAAPPDAPAKLQSLIQDSDPQVRRAAFSALKHLRERKTARAA
jgi:HEAT repeat protein